MYLMALSDSTIHPGSGKWSPPTLLASATQAQAYESQPLLWFSRYMVCMATGPDCPDADTFSCSACAHVRVALNVSESYGGRMLVDELDGLPEIPLGPDVEQALGLHSSGTAAVQRMALSRKAAEHVVQVDDHAGVSGGREDRQEAELHLLRDDPECVGPELPSSRPSTLKMPRQIRSPSSTAKPFPTVACPCQLQAHAWRVWTVSARNK